MTRVGRRAVLQALAGIPAVGRAISAFQSSPAVEQGGRDLAVRVIRMVNTTEAWHQSEFGSYVGIHDLMRSSALARLRGDRVAESAGIGASLLSGVFPEGPDVFPGWGLGVWLRAHAAEKNVGNGYVAAVWEKSGGNGHGFASDDSGRIYEGSAAPEAVYRAGLGSVQDLLRRATPLCGRPAGGPMRRTLDRVLRQAAFLTVAVQPASLYCCCPCGPLDCLSCSKTCGCSSGGYNCGCIDCVWISCTPAQGPVA